MEIRMLTMPLVLFSAQNIAPLPTGEWGGLTNTKDKSAIIEDSATSAQTLTDAMVKILLDGYITGL